MFCSVCSFFTGNTSRERLRHAFGPAALCLRRWRGSGMLAGPASVFS